MQLPDDIFQPCVFPAQLPTSAVVVDWFRPAAPAFPEVHFGGRHLSMAPNPPDPVQLSRVETAGTSMQDFPVI
ncbi:hypothetical protein Cob_v004289 [Colletotrichum orbiculare MAFF 240422]|uniref:Uncharacterized protein n=1 Tax=Colletotrichum orbiculare (strain 104-T / ATCC 96160 / CBS 514.97 / LARS 414 / MAFF 240422) TaxID=1213857 RepID=A0A484FYM5_COLOR|nr:hypothetical protein Cob_v004289 [Colletotrichum orbiculare MAFF 240422]